MDGLVLAVYQLKTAVGYKALRHTDALGGLVVLQNRGHDARQGKGRTVQRVAELGLLVRRTAVTALQTVGLIGVEIGYRRYLQPALLSLGIYLEIVADGAGETLVAAAEQQNAVGELELLQQTFHMIQHLLVALLRVLGGVYADYLYLRELMQTVQTAHVLAVGTGLAAETLGVGAVLDGQVLLVEYHVAVYVGHGHLGGGNEVEVVHLAVVHLTFLVGQLAGTVAGSGVHHGGGHQFGIAGFPCLIEEEIDKSALQTGALADVYRKTGTGDFHTEVEVYQIVFFGKLPVGKLGGLQVQLPTVSVPSHSFRLLFTTWLSSAALPSGTSS